MSNNIPNIIRSILDGDEKIVGGVIAKEGEFPWVVGIWRKRGLRPFCGGSLLNNRLVFNTALKYYKSFLRFRNVWIYTVWILSEIAC